MQEATYSAVGAVCLECAWRAAHTNLSTVLQNQSALQRWALFPIAYTLCIGTIFLNLKKFEFFSSDNIRNVISIAHALDGLVALLLGVGMYFENRIIILVAILFLTKFFLLHFLARMVNGEQTTGTAALCLGTTKAFIHHLGSFFFLVDPTTTLITTAWRFISMNGHAVLALRGHIDHKIFRELMWFIAHSRNVAIVAILVLCAVYPSIRRGFGEIFSEISIYFAFPNTSVGL